MCCIDGCVFPFPSGIHSVSRCIHELKSLGFSGMVACGAKQGPHHHPGFSIYQAEYIGNKNHRDLRREIQACTREGTLCIIKAGDASFNRSILTTPGIFTLCELHLAPKNAFDRVCASVAADRNVAIDIRITPLIELRGVARERVVRLNEEILLLQNRYEFPVTISSGARRPSDMRSRRAIESLLSEMGMEKDLINTALSGIPELVRIRRPPGIE